ncbi:MAG TPA: 50S ribosomal protein L9 [Desulfonatronum sp.]|nr:50S ribosomal protein L9 [Desulfonatronum sp.]
MEVILRTNIEKLGQLGQTVKVKPGYGRNYLLPQGLAMLATPGNKKRYEQEHKKLQARIDAERFAAQEIADKINAVVLRAPVRVGEGDKLYGSVTSAQIVDMLAKEHGIELDKKKLHLDDTLRALGDYSLEVRLHQDVKAHVRVLVVRHDAGPDPEPVASETEGAVADEPEQQGE